jgi:hypothetical protein
MGGIFSKSNRPTLAGAYFNFEAAQADPIPSSPGTAAAILFRHDWGPVGEVVRCPSFQHFQAIYGDSDDTEGYLAVRQAFQGEDGENGRFGAGEVVGVRLAGSAAAKAAITIEKTGAAGAITLTARYEGTVGNSLTATVSTVSSGVDRLTILKGTVEVERYDYADTDIDDLAEQINASSDWVDAAVISSGTDLDQATDGALTGGNDGTTLISADYTDAMAVLEIEPFAVVACANLTDSGITATFNAWVDSMNESGKRFFGVTGGAAAETMTTAVTRANAAESPNIVTVGVLSVVDERNGSDGDEVTLASGELVPRIAGILAGRGEYASLVGARLPGLRIVSGPTIAEQVTAFDEGVVTISRDSSATSPVFIRTGLTTWTESAATADPSRPYRTFRQPKYVRTMHGIETDLTSLADARVGTGAVNSAARLGMVGDAKALLSAREQVGVIQPGWAVGVDQNPPPTDEDEFIALTLACSFGRSLDQIFWTASVG